MRKWMVQYGLFSLFFCLMMVAGQAQVIDSAEVKEWVDIPVIEWEEYYSYEGGFRVRTPGPMTERVDTIKTALGPMAYHTFMYLVNDEEYAENVFYMVSYCDYPPGALHQDSTDLLAEFFDATVAEAVRSVRGQLVYSNPIDYLDYPGQIWRIHFRSGDAVIKTKALIVDDRYYTIQTVMKREMALNRASDTFLDSFRLLNE